MLTKISHNLAIFKTTTTLLRNFTIHSYLFQLFTNLQHHIPPFKSPIFNSGLFCSVGYFLIIISFLLSTCFCGRQTKDRSNKPMVIVDEEEVEEFQSNDDDDELNASEYLDYECPQVEGNTKFQTKSNFILDKNTLLPPNSSLLAELKQNRQFLRQKSTHEVEIELDSNDKIDIEI